MTFYTNRDNVKMMLRGVALDKAGKSKKKRGKK